MTDRHDRADRFAALFEAITGRSTVTERQRIDVAVRCDERGTETDVAAYLDTVATARGFDDVIE